MPLVTPAVPGLGVIIDYGTDPIIRYGENRVVGNTPRVLAAIAAGELTNLDNAQNDPNAPTSSSSGTIETVNTVATSGAAQTLPDVTTATIHRITLSANCTLTFPTATAGKSFTVILIQDATGSRTVTWPAAVKWQGGTAPTLTTTASKRDVFTFLCVDGTNWLGFVSGQNFS